MFEYYTFGMQAKPIRRNSLELSPKEVARVGEQHEQRQCPSPPLSAAAVSPIMTRQDSKSTTDTVDCLAQELSRQNLQLDRANLEHLQFQLSSPSISPQIPSMSPIPPCPELEIDDEPPPRLDPRCRRQAVPASLSPNSAQMPPSFMEVDPRPNVGADMKRLNRQRSSQFHNNPNNSKTIQTLVEDMVASGSQCNVHRAAPPPLTPTSTERLGPILEPDDDEMRFDVGSLDLQVDEAYVNGPTPDTEKEETFLIESMMTLRRAGGPAGIRKMGVLQYRAATDAALSCANVVRSRPRMRKRGRMHRGSKASSIVSSAFSSPVIPPSLPDDSRFPVRPL